MMFKSVNLVCNVIFYELKKKTFLKEKDYPYCTSWIVTEFEICIIESTSTVIH